MSGLDIAGAVLGLAAIGISVYNIMRLDRSNRRAIAKLHSATAHFRADHIGDKRRED